MYHIRLEQNNKLLQQPVDHPESQMVNSI